MAAKFGIVMSSQLGTERWDAQFHLAQARVKKIMEKLQQKFAKEEVVEKLNGLTEEQRKPVLEIVSGNSVRSKLRNGTLFICKRYPYLALALIVEAAPQIRKEAKTKIQNEISALDGLEQTLAGCE